VIQLNVQSIVQIGTLIVYAILISLVLCSKKVALKKLFVTVLAAAAGISLAGLLTNVNLPYEQMVAWKLAAVLFSSWLVVAYAHFIAAYARKNTGKVVKIGYAWLALTFAIAACGFLAQGLGLLESEGISAVYGYAINAVVNINDAIAVGVLFFIINLLRKSAEPEERNRAAYLLAGAIIMISAGVLKYIVEGLPFTVSQLGYAANVVIIASTLMKYHLLDIQVLVRKWLVYTGVTACMTLAFLTLLLVLSNLLRLLPPQLGIPATIGLVIFFAYLFNWVKATLDKAADRLFYGSRYVNRQLLLSFASKVSSFINIKEIANELMKPLANAVRARQVGLLLLHTEFYSTKFIARLSEEEQISPIMFSENSQVIKWVEDSGLPLTLEVMERKPEFNQLTAEDKEAINAFQIEVLCPIVAKTRMVAILALSKKQGSKNYTRDDIDLVTTLAKESAVAIENAQIYEKAKEQADMDGLTGLHNHRSFQDCYNREIEHCAVSGDDFSLLFIDLDFFKTYNDIYGHGMGDEILKEVGRIIKTSIRETDVGARYGGDEFAILLKQSTGAEAKVVAERVRGKIEGCMTDKGITLTCSIGVASWRVDGVARDAIIQAADKAVYAAKEAGRNRVVMACEIETAAQSPRPEAAVNLDNNAAIDNIVFSLASTVDARDHYTFGHSKVVCKYAAELAKAIGYDAGGIRRIRAAALLHDIGKLNLPDCILTKRGPLTDEEWETIKHHPELALEIIKYIVGLRDCIDAILHHHERYDGQGYPKGLKGTDIPMDARIMAIADAYDAMRSERNYKERGMTEEEALAELERCSGTQFDPELVMTFIKMRRKAIEEALYEAAAPNRPKS
jgi:diguanylate cyclase (GGDEF)-like protein/putative nucleotidyltransferase with HDIG domain